MGTRDDFYTPFILSKFYVNQLGYVTQIYKVRGKGGDK